MPVGYKPVVSRITVVPDRDPIFSEYSTHIEITDLSGGPFLQVYQIGDGSKREHDHQINIDIDQWPALREAIDRMIETAKGMTE